MSERHSVMQAAVCLEEVWEGRMVTMSVGSCTAIVPSTSCLACADSQVVEDLFCRSLHGGFELSLGVVFRGCF